MSDIEGHVCFVRGDQHNWLMECVSQSKLIQNVRISARQLRDEYLRPIQTSPYLINDLAGTKYICVCANRSEASLLDCGFIDGRVVSTERRSEWHHHEAGIGRFKGNT